MNDWLANSLSLKSPIEVLDTTTESSYKLLVLYTPLEDAESIRRAYIKGAGQVGDYDNVSYNTRGTGRFIPVKSKTCNWSTKQSRTSNRRTNRSISQRIFNRSNYSNHL